MKQISTTSFALLFFLSANSQMVKNVRSPLIIKKQLNLNSSIFDTSSLRKLHNGNYVAILKQDNMPCIIPQPLQLNMPNSYNGEKVYIGKIPNLGERRDTIWKKK